MQELIDITTIKIAAICMVAFLISLPIVVSRGFRGLLIMMGALTIAVYIQEKWQNVKYSSLSFFVILLVCCLFVRSRHE